MYLGAVDSWSWRQRNMSDAQRAIAELGEVA
jgi:hypothetical protein